MKDVKDMIHKEVSGWPMYDEFDFFEKKNRVEEEKEVTPSTSVDIQIKRLKLTLVQVEKKKAKPQRRPKGYPRVRLVTKLDKDNNMNKSRRWCGSEVNFSSENVLIR